MKDCIRLGYHVHGDRRIVTLTFDREDQRLAYDRHASQARRLIDDLSRMGLFDTARIIVNGQVVFSFAG